MAPLFVVKVNWACTAMGKPINNSIRKIGFIIFVPRFFLIIQAVHPKMNSEKEFPSACVSR
jgi:hypothetical protein